MRFFFFFQAEDGIRDIGVTGVQTCALPISVYSGAGQFDGAHRSFVLQPNGQIDQAEGYRNLIVARNKDRSPVYLRDIAEVIQGVQDERTSRFFWMRGFNPPGSIVVLAVSRQAGAKAV